jgi:aromatic ring-cleaving dioxygenase
MSTYTQRQKSAPHARPLNLYRRAGRRTETLRGYIPKSVEPHDSPMEIVDVFRVSYATACIWLRVLRGPVKRN